MWTTNAPNIGLIDHVTAELGRFEQQTRPPASLLNVRGERFEVIDL